jgi:hypothetical protein
MLLKVNGWMINFKEEFPFALRRPFLWGRLEALPRRKSTVSPKEGGEVAPQRCKPALLDEGGNKHKRSVGQRVGSLLPDPIVQDRVLDGRDEVLED